jgi:hypothetical protein
MAFGPGAYKVELIMAYSFQGLFVVGYEHQADGLHMEDNSQYKHTECNAAKIKLSKLSL